MASLCLTGPAVSCVWTEPLVAREKLNCVCLSKQRREPDQSSANRAGGRGYVWLLHVGAVSSGHLPSIRWVFLEGILLCSVSQKVTPSPPSIATNLSPLLRLRLEKEESKGPTSNSEQEVSSKHFRQLILFLSAKNRATAHQHYPEMQN